MRYALIVALLLGVGCSSGSPTGPTKSDPGGLPPLVGVTPGVTPTLTTPTTPTQPSAPTPNPLLSDPRFDRAFFSRFTFNPLRRWTQAPRIYLRTVSNGGTPISSALLDQTAAALINTTSQWTGGAFGVAGLERGTGTMQAQAGWITVAWDNLAGFCGTVALTSVNQGNLYNNVILLNHAEPACTCGPLTVKHELGHALGYNHTDSNQDVMSGTPLDGTVCDKPLSAREEFHARVLYSLAPGSSAP